MTREEIRVEYQRAMVTASNEYARAMDVVLIKHQRAVNKTTRGEFQRAVDEAQAKSKRAMNAAWSERERKLDALEAKLEIN